MGHVTLSTAFLYSKQERARNDNSGPWLVRLNHANHFLGHLRIAGSAPRLLVTTCSFGEDICVEGSQPRKYQHGKGSTKKNPPGNSDTGVTTQASTTHSEEKQERHQNMGKDCNYGLLPQ